VGQSGGHLDEAFLRLNQYLELEGTALKRAKAALRYPMFVFGSLIAALVIVNVFVIPTFASVFAMSHTKLPLETVILMGMSNFIRHNWILLCVLIVATIFGIRRYLKTPQGQLKWSQYQLQIPKVGSILRRIVLLRFAQSFSVVINSGIPLLEGIRLVSDTVNNEYAKQEILAIGDSIEHGRTLTQAVATSHLFTPLELQMLMVGEETGELGLLLEQIADFYRREVDYDLKRLNDIIEPILLIGLAVIIMILAFAVYLPIWNMVKLVHN
jgi:MSHA biogenesis protein MshG